MGAWGYRIFQDDTSLDALNELLKSENVSADIERFLNGVISSGGEYMDYDICLYAMTAAAVIDGALNGVDFSLLTEEDGGIDGFKRLCGGDYSHLREKAALALELICGDNSETAELWEENEELFPLWKENIDKIRARLGKCP